MRLVRQILIDAPGPRVWALVDDERNLPLWMPLVLGTRHPDGSAGGKKVGARFIQTLQEHPHETGGKTSEYAGEVTEYKPGQLIGMRLRPEAFTVDVRYYVARDPDYDCTRLVYTCDTRANSWYGWAMLMIGAKTLGRIADQQLAGIKRAAEDPDVVVHGAAKASRA